MSHGDFVEFAPVARRFRYKRLGPMFATNSIKLIRARVKLVRTGSPSTFVPYIWIDPPWRLWNAKAMVASSLSYPDPRRVIGRYMERNWFKGVRGFVAARPRLLSIGYRSGGRTRFRFSQGWVIESLDSHTPPRADGRFQDWYARRGERK